MKFPDNWYVEHDGQRLILDPDKVEAEIERLRALLGKAYQFISPHSDPMGISNTAMAAEIMRALEQKDDDACRPTSGPDPQPIDLARRDATS